MNMHNTPALQRNLPEIVDEYETKKAALPDLVEAYKQFHTDLDMATTIAGTYVGRVVDYSPGLSLKRLEANLLESAWRHVYKGLNIDKIATASDRSKFDLSLKNPPEFTMDNIRATFGDYWINSSFHILRGLAEVFCELDPAYKSHSKIKIGVEGLPKRIILTGFSEYSYSSYGQNKMRDVMNAIANYTGREQVHDGHISDMTREARKNGEAPWWGGTLKVFKNGNGHLSFDKQTLFDVNMALAEFYGDVLPDTPDEPEKKQPGTDVAKDLQYYPTPQAVIDKILAREVSLLNDGKGLKFLEPDCGDGRIMSSVQTLYPEISTVGVEVHPGRAQEAHDHGHQVLLANFLEIAPDPSYDLIVMNPPFYGLHWQKHLLHAYSFLNKSNRENRRGRSTLICILPASAYYDGHLGEMGLIPKDAHLKERGWRDTGWNDLPVASFAESGTNVPTGYLVMGAAPE